MKNRNAKTLTIAAAFPLFLLVFSSCKKEKPVLPETPVAAEKGLVIRFSNQTIPVSSVDSGTLLIRNQANDIVLMETMVAAGDSLFASTKNLPAGNYTAEFYINTKKENDNTARQYALKKTFTLPLTANITVNATAGTFEGEWYKRAVFFGPNNEMTVTVAMDPRDAYYGLSFKEAKWVQLGIERASLFSDANGSIYVAGKDHKKVIQPGVIGLGDYAGFESYTTQMNGKPWNRGVISVYLLHENGRDVYFDYEYTR